HRRGDGGRGCRLQSEESRSVPRALKAVEDHSCDPQHEDRAKDVRRRDPPARRSADAVRRRRCRDCSLPQCRRCSLTPVLRYLTPRNLRLGVIVVPWLIAAVYLYAFAADRYVAESIVAVREEGQ